MKVVKKKQLNIIKKNKEEIKKKERNKYKNMSEDGKKYHKRKE